MNHSFFLFIWFYFLFPWLTKFFFLPTFCVNSHFCLYVSSLCDCRRWAGGRAVEETLPQTLSTQPLSSSLSLVSMAMSSDPGYMGPDLDPDSSSSTSSSPTPLSAKMAAITITDPFNHGLRNGAGHKRPPHQRPHLSGRKMSLQERGTYLSAGGGAERISHISPRAPRRPTIESKRVSISDSQVSQECVWI